MPVENEQPPKAALIATTGAINFGIGLFATGNISGELPLEWILLPARIVTLICIALRADLGGAAYLLFRERPGRQQVIAVVVIITGVVTLTLVS